MRAPLCCLQNSSRRWKRRHCFHNWQPKWRGKRTADKTTQSTNNSWVVLRGVEWWWNCCLWTLLCFALLHSLFLITHWKCTGDNDLFFWGHCQECLAYTSLYWLFMLFYEAFYLFQSRVIKVAVSTCASSPSVCRELCLGPKPLRAVGTALPLAGSG